MFNKLNLKESKRYSLGKENVKKYKEHLDFIEYGNSNVPGLAKASEIFGNEIGIDGLYNSDSHTLDYIFSSNMIFPELDFSNWKELKNGIKKEIQLQNTTINKGRNRIFEKIYHGLSVIYNIARQKKGL